MVVTNSSAGKMEGPPRALLESQRARAGKAELSG